MSAPAHCLVQGHMNAAHEPRRQPALCHRLRDAAARCVERPLLLPGQRRARRRRGAGARAASAVAARAAARCGWALPCISSDAGHAAFDGPALRARPAGAARLRLQRRRAAPPMAKQPDRQGLRPRDPTAPTSVAAPTAGGHAMVAAVRSADQYDGILAGDPGFNLPKAAVAQLYGVQQYAAVATAKTRRRPARPAERLHAGRAEAAWPTRCWQRCDALDGLADGIVVERQCLQDALRHGQPAVPTCAAGTRDGICLSAPQKNALADVFKGARNSAGQPIYSSFPFDGGRERRQLA